MLMTQIPTSLDAAIAQAQAATQAAIAAGYNRMQVELLIPELKAMPVAQQFVPTLAEAYGAGLKVFFSDAGAAALARRDWGDIPFRLSSLDVAGSRQTTPVEDLVDDEDTAFLFVSPTAVEVSVVEQVCNAVGDAPVVLLNPRLEDISVVGLGYAARQIRNRFLNTFEPCYYLRPLEGAALLRCYPSPWQVWQETEANYVLLAEELLKPDSERLDAIFRGVTGDQKPPRQSLLSRMQQMFNALGR